MYICSNTPTYNVKLGDFHYKEEYFVVINSVVDYELFQIV